MGQIQIRVGEMIQRRELSEGRRVPVAEVAREAGVAPDVVAGLVRGDTTEISLPTLAKLCEYFGCTVGSLLYYDEDPDVFAEDEVESRDIVARWERSFGADEHPPD